MSLTHQISLSEECPGTLHLGQARMVLLDIESSFWGLRRQLEALVGWRLTDAVLQQAGANGGAAFARAFASADFLHPLLRKLLLIVDFELVAYATASISVVTGFGCSNLDGHDQAPAALG